MKIKLIYLDITDNHGVPGENFQERLYAVVNNEEDLNRILADYKAKQKAYEEDTSIPQFYKEIYTKEIRIEEIEMNKLIG